MAAMNARLLRPRRFGVVGDSDVVNYIAAVEAADGQALEQGVRDAFAAFITGCKDDGIWDAVGFGLVLAGARTLAGALTPLTGGATPTNNNFVSGDYNRKTGLVGNGSTKYINTNVNHNAICERDNEHMAAWVTSLPGGTLFGSAGYNGAGCTNLYHGVNIRCQSNAVAGPAYTSSFPSIRAINRSAADSFTVHHPAAETISIASDGVSGIPILVFACWNGPNVGAILAPTQTRISFFSAGLSLSVTDLSSRVSTLMTSLSAVIP